MGGGCIFGGTFSEKKKKEKIWCTSVENRGETTGHFSSACIVRSGSFIEEY